MPHMHDRFQGTQSFDEALRGSSQRRSGDSEIAERYTILLQFICQEKTYKVLIAPFTKLVKCVRNKC